MNIYEKLMDIRVQVLDAGIKKTGHNKFSNFWYHELKDFLAFTTKLFKKVKLYSRFSITPATPTSEEMAVMKIVNSEKPEEVEIYTLPTAECFIGRKKDGTGGADPIQNLGGKITYLRRYMYFLVLDLIEDDSVDSKEQHNNHKKVEVDKNSSLGDLPEAEALKQAIANGMTALNITLDKFDNIEYKDDVTKTICGIYGVKEWKDVTFKTNEEYKKLKKLVVEQIIIEKALKLAGI